jgi:hypothetical protein
LGLENGFWRDAGNGHRDGRAPQQCPSRAANGSLGWTNGAKGVSIGDMRSPCFLVAVGILALAARFSYAEDLTTLDGKIFTNITEVTKYPKQVFITYNEKRISIAITNLSEEFRTKYKIQSPSATPAITTQQTSPTDLFLAQCRNLDVEVEKTISERLTNSSEMITNNVTGEVIQLGDISIHDCSLVLNPRMFKLKVYKTQCEPNGLISTNATDQPVGMGFRFGEEAVAHQIFDKFIEWENIAANNKAEAFEKDVARLRDPRLIPGGSDALRTFTFKWNKDSIVNKSGYGFLIVDYPSLDSSATDWLDWTGFGGSVEKSDALAFEELLNSIPALKEDLAQKIRNQEAQKNLFK